MNKCNYKAVRLAQWIMSLLLFISVGPGSIPTRDLHVDLGFQFLPGHEVACCSCLYYWPVPLGINRTWDMSILTAASSCVSGCSPKSKERWQTAMSSCWTSSVRCNASRIAVTSCATKSDKAYFFLQAIIYHRLRSKWNLYEYLFGFIYLWAPGWRQWTLLVILSKTSLQSPCISTYA